MVRNNILARSRHFISHCTPFRKFGINQQLFDYIDCSAFCLNY